MSVIVSETGLLVIVAPRERGRGEKGRELGGRERAARYIVKEILHKADNSFLLARVPRYRTNFSPSDIIRQPLDDDTRRRRGYDGSWSLLLDRRHLCRSSVNTFGSLKGHPLPVEVVSKPQDNRPSGISATIVAK